MWLFKLIKNQKVYLEILDQFKRLIATGTLSVGSRLPSERQMAEEMNVSRATIRETMHALELIGVVRCVQGEGNFLTDNLNQCMVEPLSIMFMLGCKDVRLVQQLRHGLEVQTASLAALNATDTQAAELEKICTRIETSRDPLIRADMDSKFHYMIADIAGNPLITSILNAAETLIENLITNIRSLIINDIKDSQLIVCQHTRITDAIKNHDPIASAAAMDNHMKHIASLIKLYM